MTPEELDALPAADAERALLAVCTAPRWAAQVAAGRPHGTTEAWQAAAAEALTDADLEPALAGHPRIGDRAAAARPGSEQARVAGAEAGVLATLAEGNRAYEERFGHVYLVCASGRSAEDLLAVLRSRLGNDPVTERGVALGELAAINRLRLDALLRS